MNTLDRKLKVLILGHRGMLGHMVKLYLEQFYEIETIEDRWPTLDFKMSIQMSDSDYLINCIGAIPQRTKDFDVNFELPVWLDGHFNGRIIHPGTDCEMDNDEYGVSKAKAANWLLESGIRTKIIKTSIIGYELNGSASLMEWFLSNKDGDSVKGYTNHFWNGSTTLQWAKHAAKMIEGWSKQMDLTIIGTECVSKWEILNSINKKCLRNINVEAHDTGSVVDKCLDLDVKYGHVEDQIKEMKEFYEARKTK